MPSVAVFADGPLPLILGRAAVVQGNSYLEQAADLPASLLKPTAPAEAKDMVELFAPLRGLNLDFERDRDTGRDINL